MPLSIKMVLEESMQWLGELHHLSPAFFFLKNAKII